MVDRLNALHGFLAEQRSEDVGGQEAAGTSLGRVGDSMRRSVQNLQIEAFCCSIDKSSDKSSKSSDKSSDKRSESADRDFVVVDN